LSVVQLYLSSFIVWLYQASNCRVVNYTQNGRFNSPDLPPNHNPIAMNMVILAELSQLFIAFFPI